MELMGRIVLPELPELSFDEESHIYMVNGNVVPSVTQLMKPLSEAKYANIPQSTLDNAAKRGTEIHSAIEFFVKYGFEEIESEYQGYFDAFKAWWRTLDNPSVLASEYQSYFAQGDEMSEIYGSTFAGTMDLVGFIGGAVTIVDFKSTSTISDMLCGVQLEAYAQILKSYGIVPERKLIVQLRPDARYSVREYVPNDTLRWGVFRALRIIDNYKKSGGNK